MINPFLSIKNESSFNKLKIFIMTISGIAIVRFILFYFFFILSNIFLYLLLIGYSSEVSGEFIKMNYLRRKLIYFPQLLLRISLLFLGYFWFFENNNKYNIFDFEYLERDNSPRLIIINHSSFIDSFYLMTRGFPSFVSSYNNLNIPIIGYTIKKLGCILVPTNEDQRKILPDAKTQITHRLLHDSVKNFKRPLVIFPEGCTKNSKYLFKFQQGAFMNDLNYQPIILKYNFKNLDPSWTFDSGMVKLVYYLCCQFYNTLEVEYMNPTNLSANQIKEIYAKKLNLISTELSNHDSNLLLYHQDKIDYIYKYIFEGHNKYNIEYYKRKTNLKPKEFSEIVELFYYFDDNKMGSINLIDLNRIKNRLNPNILIIENKLFSFHEMIELLFPEDKINKLQLN